MNATAWYEALRAEWRPASVKLLLIGESAPDSGAIESDRRFFYAPTISGSDNLFRGVVSALYDGPKLRKGEDRRPWLERLRADGVYLIDLVPYPVDKLSAGERRRARRDHVDSCVATAVALSPEGIIVCHGPTFELLSEPLRDNRMPVLHAKAIPFPLGNHRERFVESFRAALNQR